MKLVTHWRHLAAITVGLGLTAAALMAGTPARPKESAVKLAESAKSDKLIVHEWGTFTSFSGSNGVQLDFRPLVSEDLPGFVLDRLDQSGESKFLKARIRARVRMETPVTYFYTDRERTVRASVEFPQGLLTEFYPPVFTMDRPDKEQTQIGNSKLDWGEIDLIPAAAFAPNVKDESAKAWLQQVIEERVLPQQGSPSNHYYHARETDSAFVHARFTKSPEAPFRPVGDFIEKFLFYRGVGKFEQPLNVVVSEDGQFSVTNSGSQPIRSLFRVTVEDKSITVSELNEVAAGKTARFPATEQQVTNEQLQSLVEAALVREQLYPREATAMVKTWADSWFAEQGTRIFYMVPRETTDKILPLTISPAPDETVRVLVGRVEVMPPSVEKKLTEVVRLHGKQRDALVKKQKELNLTEPVSLAMPTAIAQLGRLAEPALVRVQQLCRDESVSREAATLLSEYHQSLMNH